MDRIEEDYPSYLLLLLLVCILTSQVHLQIYRNPWLSYQWYINSSPFLIRSIKYYNLLIYFKFKFPELLFVRKSSGKNNQPNNRLKLIHL